MEEKNLSWGQDLSVKALKIFDFVYDEIVRM
jgi:hypothetical protein